jgi:hypothetical protein
MELFSNMDEETAALIIRLQMEENRLSQDQYIGKGKSVQGNLSDRQLVLKLFQDDLERTAALITDRIMTKSIAHACQADGQLLVAALSKSNLQPAIGK